MYSNSRRIRVIEQEESYVHVPRRYIHACTREWDALIVFPRYVTLAGLVSQTVLHTCMHAYARALHDTELRFSPGAEAFYNSSRIRNRIHNRIPGGDLVPGGELVQPGGLRLKRPDRSRLQASQQHHASDKNGSDKNGRQERLTALKPALKPAR